MGAIAILLSTHGCSTDSPVAPTAPPTQVSTPTPAPVVLTCIPVNREFEDPKCRQYGLGPGKLDPIDGPYLELYTAARLAVKESRPDLFGERSQGFQVLDNREYQGVLLAELSASNPGLCFAIDRQDDEILAKERGVAAVAPAASWHYDILCEGDGREPNEACEFLAASCSPPWF